MNHPFTFINPEFTPPNDPTMYKQLNVKDFSLTCAEDYQKVHLPDGLSGYQSMDPRTFDSPRAQRLLLDRPPLYSRNTQPQKNLYAPSQVQTGYYPSYESIKGGQYIYYTDKSIDVPYTNPTYVNQVYMQPTVFVDPMGASQTIYERIPIFKNNRNTSDYTFDQDQMEFREDLMSKQSQLMNKNAYGTYSLYKNKSL